MMTVYHQAKATGVRTTFQRSLAMGIDFTVMVTFYNCAPVIFLFRKEKKFRFLERKSYCFVATVILSL